MPTSKLPTALPPTAVETHSSSQTFTQYLYWVIGISTISLIVWSFATLEFDFTHLRSGMGAVSSELWKSVPKSRTDMGHDLGLWPSVRDGFEETLQMAICGTVIGGLLAFPVSFLAARTGAVPRAISGFVKTGLNAARAIPTIVYALLAVAVVGLGAPAGAAAIALVTFFSLGKMFAEALESVSPGPVEAVRAAGGNPAQVFVFGMMPQVLPIYLSNTLYSLEYNLKDSFVVGIVGAGGLGAALRNDINLFKYLDTGVIIVLLIVLVNCVDYLSFLVRRVFS